MTLIIDVGNSNICFGIHDGEKLISSYRIKSFKDKSCDEFFIMFHAFLNDTNVKDIVMSSVVPTITSALKKMCLKYYHQDPLIVGQGSKTGLKLVVDDAKTVGADLICDVVGANEIASEGLVIDLGTASKFLYYKDKGFYGCAIAPGIAVSTNSMISSAALLPNMEFVTPKKVLNTSTIPCMQAGVLYGFASLVDGMIERIKKEVNQPNLKVIATGGLTSLIIPLLKQKVDMVEPNLTLLGAYHILLKNK